MTDTRGKISALRLPPKATAAERPGPQDHPENLHGTGVLRSRAGRGAVAAVGGASGNTRLAPELAELAGLEAAHGRDALIAALERAITFRRWKASGVRSILAAGTGVAQPTEPGQALVIELPASSARPLAADLEHGLRRLKLASVRVRQ